MKSGLNWKMKGVSFYTLLEDNLGVALDTIALHNSSLCREKDPDKFYKIFFN